MPDVLMVHLVPTTYLIMGEIQIKLCFSLRGEAGVGAKISLALFNHAIKGARRILEAHLSTHQQWMSGMVSFPMIPEIFSVILQKSLLNTVMVLGIKGQNQHLFNINKLNYISEGII